eukprot:COSAG02_NODE_58340_length_277_cov_1.466292_1_plen_66_part_01
MPPLYDRCHFYGIDQDLKTLGLSDDQIARNKGEGWGKACDMPKALQVMLDDHKVFGDEVWHVKNCA